MPNSAPEIIVYIGRTHEQAERFRLSPAETAFGWERCVKGTRWEQCPRLVAGLLDALVAARAKVPCIDPRTGEGKAFPLLTGTDRDGGLGVA